MRRLMFILWTVAVFLPGSALLAQTLTGSEILVARPPDVPNGTSSQTRPRVAIDGQRNVFVVWERREDDIFNPPDDGIYGRFFDGTDASPGELTLADGPLNETEPVLAGNATQAVLAYQVDDLSNIPACTTPPFGKVFRRVFINGTATTGEQVNANGGGGRKPAVGVNAAGTSVVAYEGNECPGLGIQKGIKLRRFDPNRSVALDGVLSELPLAADVDAAGGMAVVVVEGSPGSLCDTSAPCPMTVRRFNADGTPRPAVTFAPYANTGTVTTFDPVIAVREDGGFVVVWVRLDFDTTQTLFVVGRRYNAAGNPLGPEFEVSAGVVPPSTQGFAPPAIAMSSNGEFVVGFVVEGRAFVRGYSADGSPRGPAVPVTGQDVEAISVALGDDGRGAVAYTSSPEQTVYYRRFSLSTTSTVCTPSSTVLCLNQGRFKVTANWRIPGGTSGAAQVVPLTADTGYLWFFNAANVEAVVKVLNGCGVNSRYWVFAGGLTDVDVELTVEDTRNGSLRVYRNPQGTPFQPIQDTDAFATCP